MTDIFIKVQVNPMTIVEFFDREMLENIIGTLMFQPERVVLFGRDLKKLAAFQKNMAQVLANKNIHTKILIESVNTTEYASVVKKLNGFIDAYPDCVFDLTGGEELILVAMEYFSRRSAYLLVLKK